MIYFLLALIFVSKISGAFLGFIPYQVEPFLFQFGLHPYVNIVLNFLVGGLLLIKWLWSSQRLYNQSRFYRFLLFTASLYLIFITLLQTFFVNSDESTILQMGSAVMAVFTIYLYGRVIPTLLKPEKFLNVLKTSTVCFCLLSFVILFISTSTGFKGSRFIGVFKHIPHMVSCAMLACFSIYYSIFTTQLSRIQLLFNYFALLICYFLLILTGTRSALGAVLFGFILCLVCFKTDQMMNRFLKVSLAISALFIIIFFGHDITDYSIAVIRGEQSIAQRAAQDGIKSRLEEVERGFLLFEKNQWLGQGLLMKFANGSEADIGGYNANKDPHNVLVSAGVVGGWGFIFITLIGLCTLSFATFKSLFSKNKAIKILAIFMVANLPILLIYHVHLSIGGIADRVYWLVIGYLAIKETDLKS